MVLYAQVILGNSNLVAIRYIKGVYEKGELDADNEVEPVPSIRHNN